MANSIQNIGKIPELRKRILFTLAMLAVYRVGIFITVPGVNRVEMTNVISLTTGTAFIMWLGEQITEKGIGNGTSMIIFAGIVAGMPDALFRYLSNNGGGGASSSSSTDSGSGNFGTIILFLFVIGTIAAI